MTKVNDKSAEKLEKAGTIILARLIFYGADDLPAQTVALICQTIRLLLQYCMAVCESTADMATKNELASLKCDIAYCLLYNDAFRSRLAALATTDETLAKYNEVINGLAELLCRADSGVYINGEFVPESELREYGLV